MKASNLLCSPLAAVLAALLATVLLQAPPCDAATGSRGKGSRRSSPTRSPTGEPTPAPGTTAADAPTPAEAPTSGDSTTPFPPLSPVALLTPISTVVASDADLSTLANVLAAVDIGPTEDDDDDDELFTTLFAPINSAFTDESLNKFLTQPGYAPHLQNLLQFHATEESDSRLLSDDIQDGTVLTMRNGETVTVNVSDCEGDCQRSITLRSEEGGNDATTASVVTESDLLASNGNIHKIDRVLRPAFLAITDLGGFVDSPGVVQEFSILFELMEQLGLDDTAGDSEFTLFAPTDSALEALGQETVEALKQDPAAILSNHLILDSVQPASLLYGATTPVTMKSFGGLELVFTKSLEGTPLVNGVAITRADAHLASNGIVHILDGIIMSTNDTDATPPLTQPPPVSAPTDAAAPTPGLAPTVPPLEGVATTIKRVITYNIRLPNGGGGGADKSAVTEELETATDELAASLKSGEKGFSGEFSGPPVVTETECSDLDTDIPASDSCFIVMQEVTFVGSHDEDSVTSEVAALESAIESGGLQRALEDTGSTLSLLDSSDGPTLAPVPSSASTTFNVRYEIVVPGGADGIMDEAVLVEELETAMDELVSSLKSEDQRFSGEISEPPFATETAMQYVQLLCKDCSDLDTNVPDSDSCFSVVQAVTFIGSGEVEAADEFATLKRAIENGGLQTALEDTGSSLSLLDSPDGPTSAPASVTSSTSTTVDVKYGIVVPGGANGGVDEAVVAEELEMAMIELASTLNSAGGDVTRELGGRPVLSEADCTDFDAEAADSDKCYVVTQKVVFTGPDGDTIASEVTGLKETIDNGGLQTALEDTGSSLSFLRSTVSLVDTPDGPTLAPASVTSSTSTTVDLKYGIVVPGGANGVVDEAVVAEELEIAMIELASTLNSASDEVTRELSGRPVLSEADCTAFDADATDSDKCYRVTQKVVFTGPDGDTIASAVTDLEETIDDGGLQTALEEAGSTLSLVAIPDGPTLAPAPVTSSTSTTVDVHYGIVVPGGANGGVDEAVIAEELEMAMMELTSTLNSGGGEVTRELSGRPVLSEADCIAFDADATDSDKCYRVTQKVVFTSQSGDTIASEVTDLQDTITDGGLQTALEETGSMLSLVDIPDGPTSSVTNTTSTSTVDLKYGIVVPGGADGGVDEKIIAEELEKALIELASSLGGEFTGEVSGLPMLSEADCTDSDTDAADNDKCYTVTQKVIFTGPDEATIASEVTTLVDTIEDGGLQTALEETGSTLSLVDIPDGLTSTITNTTLTSTVDVKYNIRADDMGEDTIAEELETAMGQLASSLMSDDSEFTGELSGPPLLSEADCASFGARVADNESCFTATQTVTFTGADEGAITGQVTALETAIEEGDLQTALVETGSTLSLLGSDEGVATMTRTIEYAIRVAEGTDGAVPKSEVANELVFAMNELAEDLDETEDSGFTGEFTRSPTFSETDCENLGIAASDSDVCLIVVQEVTFTGADVATFESQFAVLESVVEDGRLREVLEDNGSTISYVDRPVWEVVQYDVIVQDGVDGANKTAVREELQRSVNALILDLSGEGEFSGRFAGSPMLSATDCSDFFPAVAESDSCWNITQDVAFDGSADEATIASDVAALEKAIENGGLQDALEDIGSTLSYVDRPVRETVEYNIIVPGGADAANETAVATELLGALNALAEDLDVPGESGFSGQFVELPTLSATDCSDFIPAVARNSSCWNVTQEVLFVGSDEATIGSDLAALKRAIGDGDLQDEFEDAGSALFYIDRPVREVINYDIRVQEGVNETVVAEELQSAMNKLGSSLESSAQFIEPAALSKANCTEFVPQPAASDSCWSVMQEATFVGADDDTVAKEVAAFRSAIEDGELQNVLDESDSALTLIAREATIRYNIRVEGGNIDTASNDTVLAETLQAAIEDLARNLTDSNLESGKRRFSGRFNKPPTLSEIDCVGFVPEASASGSCWEVLQEAAFIGTDNDMIANDVAALKESMAAGRFQNVLDDFGSDNALTLLAQVAALRYQIRVEKGADGTESALAEELQTAMNELARILADSSESGEGRFGGHFVEPPVLSPIDCADFDIDGPSGDSCWNVTQEAIFIGSEEETISSEVAALDSAIKDGELQKIFDKSDSSSLSVLDEKPAPETVTSSTAQNSGLSRPQKAGATIGTIVGCFALLLAIVYALLFLFPLFLLKKAIVAVKFEEKQTIQGRNWKDYSRGYKQRMESQLDLSFSDSMTNIRTDGDSGSDRESLERVAFKLGCDNTAENHKAFLKYIDQKYNKRAPHVDVSWSSGSSMNVLISLKTAQAEEEFRSFVAQSPMAVPVGNNRKIIVLGMTPVIQADDKKLRRAIQKAQGESHGDVIRYKHDDGVFIFFPITVGGGKRLGAVPYYRQIESSCCCCCAPPLSEVNMRMIRVKEGLVLLQESGKDAIREFQERGFEEQATQDGFVILEQASYLDLN